ncbi:MAG: hypothetical protein Q7J68_00955 [Thermoplasmata archaeon]|nr:hypothetical protein [Thermoplasmata archaeon]
MDSDLHSVSLRLAYKGDRDYLQGPDIYNAVTRIISERNPNIEFNRIKIVFHKLARNQCKMTFGNQSVLGKMPKDINAEVRFISPISDVIGWLVETDEHIIDRIPYPEEDIVKHTSIDGNSITIEGEVQFTPIEILVAMTKHLHMVLYPTKAGKWIVTRLDLTRLLTIFDASRFKVEIEKNLNNRLTKGSIHSGEEMLGYIYFSLVTL